MDIYWYGQSFFKIKGKSATVVIDPFSPQSTGFKLPKDLSADIALSTRSHPDHNCLKAVDGNPVQIAGPGEYEVKGVAITGVQSGTNTVFNVQIDNLNIVHLGDLGHELTDEQVEEIGVADILLIPVGNNRSLGAKEAAEVVSQLEPRVVIPMNYDNVDGFLKEMGVESASPLVRLSIVKDKLPQETEVVLLSKA